MKKAAESTTRATGVLTFSGHETFTLRHGWLAKAVDAVQKDAGAFNNEDAMVDLGVGKNMVRSIRHWALATGVLAETPASRGASLYVTELGKLLLDEESGVDRFNEDPNTLWLIHWKLCTNERRSTTWFWAFNLLTSIDFTRDGLQDLLNMELQRRSLSGPSEGSLKRDVDCFVRCYVRDSSGKVSEDALECPLADISLIHSSSDRTLFSFNRGPQPSLSDAMFRFALMEYWESTRPEQETIAFSELAFGWGSPGLVFKLDELSLMTRLERLNDLTNGELSYADTAGLRQVYRRVKRAPLKALAEHYHGISRTGVAA
jgi:hypothetical protein